MKKYFLLLNLLFCSVAFYAQPSAQPTGVKLTKTVEPPSIVLGKFSYENPNINPIWSMSDSLYSAQHRDETTNLGKITRYDLNGNVISRENELENNTYPVAISKYYTKKYPGEKYSIWMHEREGNKSYYINREEEIVWFNAAGKYNRTVKKGTSENKRS